jgi:hypothetical protein
MTYLSIRPLGDKVQFAMKYGSAAVTQLWLTAAASIENG